MPRLLKQIIIASIFFFIIGSAIYFFSTRSTIEPTPGQEVSIQPPLVLSSRLLKVGDLDYDFLAEIKNPNLDFGAAEAIYELKIFDKNSNLIISKTGSIDLLSGQTRYEIVSPIKTSQEIEDTEFKITNIVWEKLKDPVPPNLFLVRGQDYSLLPPSEGFSKLKATLFNNSSFDFDRVDAFVILFNQDAEVLAVGKTDIRTFLAGSNRFFEIKWTTPFAGEVAKVEVYPYTDVFKNGNFIKEHGTQERFQKFY